MKKTNGSAHVKRALLLGASISLAGIANAQLAIPTPPGGVPVGPMVAYPGVDFSISHNDNIFLTNTNTTSSTITTVTPYIRLEGKSGADKFDVGFRYTDGRYSNNSSENYSNYTLNGNADLVFSGRVGLKLRGEHTYSHDPRGTSNRPAGPTPDEYVNQGIGGVFSYGAAGAQGRIEVDGAAYSRRYQNNRTLTDVADRDTNTYGGTFFWRVAPKTELLFQVQETDTDYSLGTSTLDSTERRYLVGAKWEATALTSGTFKIGRLKRDFNSSTRPDVSSASWDAGIRWSPLTYSVFDLNTSKATSESTSGIGDVILGTSYGLTWNHAWNSRLSSALNGNWRKEEFLGTGGGREDKTTSLGVKLTYQMQRWLKFGGEYTRTDRDSNINTSDYKKNLWMFTVGATL
jgi:hypothetical protein